MPFTTADVHRLLQFIMTQYQDRRDTCIVPRQISLITSRDVANHKYIILNKQVSCSKWIQVQIIQGAHF